MREYLTAAAMCVASVGAMAKSVTDPVTGYVWTNLTRQPDESLDDILAGIPPGESMATAAQVNTFFDDVASSGSVPASLGLFGIAQRFKRRSAR